MGEEFREGKPTLSKKLTKSNLTARHVRTVALKGHVFIVYKQFYVILFETNLTYLSMCLDHQYP